MDQHGRERWKGRDRADSKRADLFPQELIIPLPQKLMLSLSSHTSWHITQSISKSLWSCHLVRSTDLREVTTASWVLRVHKNQHYAPWFFAIDKPRAQFIVLIIKTELTIGYFFNLYFIVYWKLKPAVFGSAWADILHLSTRCPQSLRPLAFQHRCFLLSLITPLCNQNTP